MVRGAEDPIWDTEIMVRLSGVGARQIEGSGSSWYPRTRVGQSCRSRLRFAGTVGWWESKHMTVSDVREIVQSARVNPRLYSFDSERHEALCLLAFGQSWKVFISERGNRHEEQTFSSEDAACVCFLKRIFFLLP